MGTVHNDTATDVVLATTEGDAAAVEAIVAHHSLLASTLSVRVDALIAAVSADLGPGTAGIAAELQGLVEFCTYELLPHAAAEEATLYPAAATDPHTRLLVEGMTSEHRVLESLADNLRHADSPVNAAAQAEALRVLFAVHVTKENNLILPVVAASPALSLTDILAGMRELVGTGHDRPSPLLGSTGPTAAASDAACGCGGSDERDALVLDVRDVPHAIRHATVFGAVSAVPVTGALILVAPHDPLPLLAQLEDREPGALAVSYDSRGPETWRVRLTRSA